MAKQVIHGEESRAAILRVINQLADAVKIEVGDIPPSRYYADRLTRVQPAMAQAVEVKASVDHSGRASCVQFCLAGR